MANLTLLVSVVYTVILVLCVVLAEGSINSDNDAASNAPNRFSIKNALICITVMFSVISLLCVVSMAVGAIVATGVLCGIGALLCIGGMVFACKKCVSDGVIV